MVEVRPEHGPRPVAYEFTYEVADSYIERQLDSEGVRVAKSWKIMFDLADLPSPQMRRRAREAHNQYLAYEGYPELPEPTDDAPRFIRAVEKWVKQNKEFEAELDSYVQDRDAEQQREAVRFNEEMSAWIAHSGSSRLAMAHARGYKANRLYAEERARKEFPLTWVDTSGKAKYRERTDPSEDALKAEAELQGRVERLERENLSARIVWLVEPPPDLEEHVESQADPEDPFAEAFQQQESILIEPYLDRYRLFLMLDPDLQNTTTESIVHVEDENEDQQVDADEDIPF